MKKFDGHTVVIIFLVVATLVIPLTFFLGGLDKTFDALAYKHGQAYSNTAEGVVGEIFYDGTKAKIDCDFGSAQERRYCTLSIRLANNELHGLDLRRFDSLNLSFEYRSERPIKNIFAYIVNFDPNISDQAIPESKKFNKLTFPANEPVDSLQISLDLLNIPDWWVQDYLTDFEYAFVDISNVTTIQFSIDDRFAEGSHELVIKQLTFHGTWISREELYLFLFTIWLLLAIVGFFYQKYLRSADANEDELTGALNRHGLHNWLESTYRSEHVNRIAMLYIDIDDFKQVNDTYGHQIGDQLLKSFFLRVRRVIEKVLAQDNKNYRNGFSRLSGDEFGLAIAEISDELIEQISSKIIASVTRPFQLSGRQVRINASIGVAVSEFRAETPELLINNADTAMYESKRSGKNQYQLFDQKLSDELILRKSISGGIRKAIDDYKFDLVYMPIYHCQSKEVVGAEVLIRCNSEELKGISPDIFIPISEEYGLIKEIDLWVLERSLQRMGDFPHTLEKFKFCINISAMELHNSDFPASLADLLERYDVSPQLIELEITETSLVSADHLSTLLLEKLRKIGVRLSLDDFGTGYTGFNQLLKYPIDTLKIDQSFISEPDNNEVANPVMVNAILSIAKSYSYNTVGEGVESEQQLSFLEESGCDYVQGFYLSEPLAWEEFIDLLRE